MKIFSAFLSAAILLPAIALAQDLTHKAAPIDMPIAIVGGAVHTVTEGVIDDGVVLIGRDGKINYVGDRRAISRDHKIVDATGKRVYPGLVSANTIMGLVEVGAVRSTLDFSETGDVTPEVRAAVAVNPDSTIIPVTRSNGILTAAVLPQAGAIPGRASVIRLDGWTWENLAIEDDAGLVINWPTVRPITAWWMTKTEEEQLKEAKENLDRIENAFAAADAYYAASSADDALATDVRWEAMRSVLLGEKPVFIRAQELEQIQSAISWAAKRNLRTIIVGGRDAASCIDMLKEHDVSVIVTGTHRMPRRRDSAYDEAFTLPVALQEAGVKWCMSSAGGGFQTPHERNLPYNAATAAAHGLDAESAIRSITIWPAEILGVSDSLGSIEEGKAGTIIITDGDPLQITSRVHHAFIDGREIDLSNKQTKLAEKYREKYRQLGLTPNQSNED